MGIKYGTRLVRIATHRNHGCECDLGYSLVSRLFHCNEPMDVTSKNQDWRRGVNSSNSIEDDWPYNRFRT